MTTQGSEIEGGVSKNPGKTTPIGRFPKKIECCGHHVVTQVEDLGPNSFIRASTFVRPDGGAYGLGDLMPECPRCETRDWLEEVVTSYRAEPKEGS